MGIQTEFNPDLALRNFGTEGREPSECLPKILEKGKTYEFLKSGQRDYWFFGEIPLLITEGNQKLSRPLAAIRILEATHFLYDGEVYTRGKYYVEAIFNISSPEVHFESYRRIK